VSPQRSDRKLDDDVVFLAIVVVGEHQFAVVEHLDAEPDVVEFGARDEGAMIFAFEQDVPRVQVA